MNVRWPSQEMCDPVSYSLHDLNCDDDYDIHDDKSTSCGSKLSVVDLQADLDKQDAEATTLTEATTYEKSITRIQQASRKRRKSNVGPPLPSLSRPRAMQVSRRRTYKLCVKCGEQHHWNAKCRISVNAAGVTIDALCNEEDATRGMEIASQSDQVEDDKYSAFDLMEADEMTFR